MCLSGLELNAQRVLNEEKRVSGKVSMCCKSICFITVVVVTINMINVFFITSHSLSSSSRNKHQIPIIFYLMVPQCNLTSKGHRTFSYYLQPCELLLSSVNLHKNKAALCAFLLGQHNPNSFTEKSKKQQKLKL